MIKLKKGGSDVSDMNGEWKSRRGSGGVKRGIGGKEERGEDGRGRKKRGKEARGKGKSRKRKKRKGEKR